MTELFANRYRIERELGRGSFGVVFLAHDTRLSDRPVALKILHPALNADPAVIRRFHQEAGMLATLDHDHIVPVYDVDTAEDRRYIVMRYIPGPTLAQLLDEEGPQSPERVFEWLKQIAQGLDYAHDQGVLHRDLKPSNLLWDEKRWRVLISDFGLAKAVQASGGSSVSQSQSEMTGTAYYMAPEVIQGQKHTAASDLYSLGCVLYELLSGEHPFEGENAVAVTSQHVFKPVPRLDLQGDIGEALSQQVMRLMAKEPNKRPQRASDVVEAANAVIMELEQTHQENIIDETRGDSPATVTRGETHEQKTEKEEKAQSPPSDDPPIGKQDGVEEGEDEDGPIGGKMRLAVILLSAVAGIIILLEGMQFVMNIRPQEPTPEAMSTSVAVSSPTITIPVSPKTITPRTPEATIPVSSTPVTPNSTRAPEPTSTKSLAKTPTASSTPTQASFTSTPTPIQATSTATSAPMASPLKNMNVRSGPGTNYPVIGTALARSSYAITGRDAKGSWWRVDFNGRDGWVFTSLVETSPSDAAAPIVTPSPPPQPTKSSTPSTVSLDQDYPAPSLIEPEKDAQVAGSVTFRWSWSGPMLNPNQAFELRLWKDGQSVHYGAYDSKLIGHNTSLTFDVNAAYGVQLGGSGHYNWTVAVVQLDPYKSIGEEAPARGIYINVGGSGAQPAPTWTPAPPPVSSSMISTPPNLLERDAQKASILSVLLFSLFFTFLHINYNKKP